MKYSQLFTKTSKDVPSDETAKNAQLLIQAGFVHKEMAGVYTFLPLGLRILENICRIIREEMDNIGGFELRLSTLQDADIWELTERWDDSKVDVWFKTKLKNSTEIGLGPTHEEPITRAMKPFIKSYKDLPILAYQIQTKFRNEVRAKSGVMRGREFLMKDMYSFARTEKEHQDLYEKIKNAYVKIFDRLGIGEETFLTFASGGMFSKFSHEFQTICDAGEDTIYLDEDKKIAINEEVNTDEVIESLDLQKKNLKKFKAAEVGNIFTLKDRFSKPLELNFIDSDDKEHNVLMGSYGIGPSRLVGVIAELLSDEKGLVWPENIAPAQIYIARLGQDKEVVDAADNLYKELQENGIEVLYDDRDVRPGEKFADADLIGIPHRIVISKKTIAQNMFEYKNRTSNESEMLNKTDLLKKLAS